MEHSELLKKLKEENDKLKELLSKKTEEGDFDSMFDLLKSFQGFNNMDETIKNLQRAENGFKQMAEFLNSKEAKSAAKRYFK